MSIPKAGLALGLALSKLSLSTQFALAGGLVAIVSMLAVGNWVSSRVANDVLANTAAATARYMDSFVSPLAQELENSRQLSIGPIRALDEMIEGPELRGRVISIKLWTPSGTIAYASDVDLIGKHFAPSDSLRSAAAGRITVELNQLEEAESEREAAVGIPLLEIYSPVRADWTGKVIAIVEFYEDASTLAQQLQAARLQSWIVTAAVTALICATLFAIVYRGDRLIAAQRSSLALRVDELERMGQLNRDLRQRAERASRRVTVLNEHNLRRVGADLHDGPVQQISFAALRLDSLQRHAGSDTEPRLNEISEALQAALTEIRELSKGLVLPELGQSTLPQTIERAIQSHEARTKTSVARRIVLPDQPSSNAVKICVYRFVQEGLNNAFRHAGGKGQEVEANLGNGRLALAVRNDVQPGQPQPSEGLGLKGLRDRVESLGGSSRFALGDKAELTLELDLHRETADE